MKSCYYDLVLSDKVWTEDEARTYYNALLAQALADIGAAAVMVIGPIRSGRSTAENLQSFQREQAHLSEQGLKVFDQRKYLDQRGRDPYMLELKFEVFYQGLIQSGKITDCYVLPGWQGSEGTCLEVGYCEERGVPVHYLSDQEGLRELNDHVVDGVRDRTSGDTAGSSASESKQIA